MNICEWCNLLFKAVFYFFPTYSSASIRSSGKNELSLTYFDSHIAPIFDDFAEDLKLFQIAPLTAPLLSKLFLDPLEQPETH